MSLAGAHKRATAIQNERARLFFKTNQLPNVGTLRYLHLLAFYGSVAIGVVVWFNCEISPLRIFSWCALILLVESAITRLNTGFVTSNPSEDALASWAWKKTALCGLNAVSWSLGPVLLHVPHQSISVLAPVWGIVSYTAAAVWVGAYFVPSMFVMMLGAILPAALWLASFGRGLEFELSICLAVSLPCMMAIGWLSVRKTGEAIENRLDIVELLGEKARQADQIAAHFSERSRFFSAASHDLRQPLNAMGFYFALLSRAAGDAERREIISRLQDCATALQRQFDAIMGISDADAAIQKTTDRAARLMEVFDKVVLTLQPEAQRKGLRLRIVLTSLWISSDPDLLERVLLNLVSNAIKYTQTGSILLGARRRNGSVIISVLDSGIGIEPAHCKTIFEDFFQVENPERNRDKGLGIGLAIVRRLCEAMKWPIEVQSVIGRGSRFSVKVPAAQAASREIASQEAFKAVIAASDAASDNSVSSDRPSILIVDDDKLIRDSLGRLLQAWGYDCLICETGDQAMALLAGDTLRRQWHVLLDWRLVGTENGLAVADRVISAHGARTRITLMTGEIEPAIEVEAQKRGIVLLRKPVRPIRLRAALAA